MPSRDARPTVAPVTTPPNGAPPLPPSEPRVMSLPFGALSWENFERLCHRLAARDGQVEHAARYGRQGQAQQGIDVYARLATGRYEVWQAKRYATFTVTQLRKAVRTFLDGNWADRSDRLVIAVQATLDDVALQEEIERQTTALAKRSIDLRVLGGDALTEQVRAHQDLVLAFFGRAWLNAFYGDAVDPAISTRLDGGEFARVRDQLARIYSARFSRLDQSIVSPRFGGPETRPDPLGLLDRYAMTDVWVRDRVAEPVGDPPPQMEGEEGAARSRPRTRSDVRRQPVATWLGEGDQIAVIADAGAGKSTLLRCIALDLLNDQALFPAFGARWGDRLPVVVSFSKWARLTAEAGNEVSLRSLVEATLQPLMTADFVALVNRAIDDRRVVLIVDGLDEWSNEQSARLTLETLLTHVEVHQIPTIASGRPHGLRKIGGLPGFWKTAELAPLSEPQQRELANSWFDHLGERSGDGAPSVGGWAADRFLRELRADAALGELAETPLLFVGLLALAVRDVALPRNRTQALESLTRLLLEIHPEARATAAGDTRPRFDAAGAWELRLSALAALAFTSRREGGDAGYPRGAAEEVIRDHLTAVNGYDATRATAAAVEMLAVNAETVGLIVEKAPGDLGFAHASLEEYLSAVHIQTWRFAELTAFFAAEAGNPRWRNVLRNLVAINPRASEIDDIVAAVEAAPVDVFGAFNRQLLLADITFGPSAMSPATGHRLAAQTFAVIDGVGPETERIGLMRIVLNGLSDPTVGASVEAHLRRWAPRRHRYTSAIYYALRDWPADATLSRIFMAGLRDAHQPGAREAATQLAARFGGQDAIGGQVRALIGGATDLHVAAAALEALTRGWPGAETNRLLALARTSRSHLLRAVALWARTRAGTHDDADLDEVLMLIGFESPLDYWDRDIAQEALFQGWPDNDRVVRDAIAARGDAPQLRDTIDRDLATRYLVGVAPGRPEVEAWILQELAGEHPFILLGSRSWSALVPHCEANAEIREGVVRHITSDRMKYREHELWELMAFVKDERLRDHAISVFQSTDHRADYWSLLALVRGWSDDPKAQAVFAEALALSDDRVQMLVSLFPELYDDPAAARNRLIRIARTVPNARWDLIVHALDILGMDGTDTEAVEALLPHAREPNPSINSADGVFAVFGQSPAVREVALARLDMFDPPLALIARGAPDDPIVRTRVEAVISPASDALRAVIVAACETSGDRHAVLAEIGQAYDAEVDFQLRVSLAINFYKLQRARGDGDAFIDRLRIEGNRRGPDWELYRSSAFAGLIVLGRAEVMNEPDQPRELFIGSPYRDGVSGPLCAVMVEHWDAMKTAFGADVPARIRSYDGSVWSWLAPYVAQNPSARADFVAWCQETDHIGLQALRSLAELMPGSDLLHAHLTKILTPPLSHDSRLLPLVATAATLLRDQFAVDPLVDLLSEDLAQSRNLVGALALAAAKPADPRLGDITLTAVELARTHGEWGGAVEMSARLEPAEQVVAFVQVFADRRPDRSWLAAVPVDALVERVRADSEVRDRLGDALRSPASPDAFVAMARLLSAAAALGGESERLCAARLAAERASADPPTAVLDVMSGEMRPLSHVLTDLIEARSGF